MKLEGRRESGNVDDRRGMGGGTKAGMGIGGMVIVALIAWLMGGNPLSVLQEADLGSMIATGDGTQREMTAEEEQLARFSRQILASTEDVWTKVFRQYGRTYQAPKMVLFTNAVRSGCGQATASVGPFYCSADQALYIDLSFFSTMKQSLGADGDFAYAYVIAHEVGHHVQYLLGTLDSAHDRMSRVSEAESNKISVRIELQADYYAGVWGYHEQQMFRSLEEGDVDEAINCALVIGDDYLQQRAQGYTVPESFNHGTSAQRKRWLSKGLSTGDMTQANTFELSDSQL